MSDHLGKQPYIPYKAYPDINHLPRNQLQGGKQKAFHNICTQIIASGTLFCCFTEDMENCPIQKFTCHTRLLPHPASDSSPETHFARRQIDTHKKAVVCRLYRLRMPTCCCHFYTH